ncbi:MAG: DUF262 domain-containing protein [Mariniphaga sp.]
MEEEITNPEIFPKPIEREPLLTDEGVEAELIDTPLMLMDKPFDPTKIDIQTKTYSLNNLINRMERGTIQMNTESYFQRQDDLWDTVKQSRLIESILLRFPLPAFFFDATNENKWLVVDGLQRLSSIRNFCIIKDHKKRLKLTNLEFLTQLNGLTWDDLVNDFGDLERVIEETQVVIYMIMPGTPTDVKFNIFKRINTGGLTLEPQEIRHVLFHGRPAEFIAELANCKEFIQATGGKIKTHRMLDRDFANRFLSFYLLGYQNYQPDLDTFMCRAMASINRKSEDDLLKIKDDFKEAMILSMEIFGGQAFRKDYGDSPRLQPINKALFDAIAVQFALLSAERRKMLKAYKELFKSSLREMLLRDVGFYDSITSSTGDKNKIIYRHRSIETLIKTLIN